MSTASHTKTCPCGSHGPFHLDGKGYKSRLCKKCYNLRSKIKYHDKSTGRKDAKKTLKEARRSAAREIVQEYLSLHPCVDCGEDDFIVLSFDHRDPTTKKNSVSIFAQGNFRLIFLVEEIAKCDVRCANCHLRRTASQFGWWKTKI